MFILYLILFFIFTAFYNQLFHLFNHLDYYLLLVPLLEFFPEQIIQIPFWEYLIAFISPYLINLFYFFIIKKDYRWSTFLNAHLNYVSNLVPLLIILGWQNFIPLNNFYQSFTGLGGLSLTYILYPTLFRLTNGRNSNSWNRKIDFYFNYYNKTFRNWFLIDNIERIYLGINGILYLINNQNAIYMYLGYLVWKIIDSLFILPNRINLRKNYFINFKRISYFVSLTIILTQLFLKLYHNFELPFWTFFINFGLNQMLSVTTLITSEPYKTKEERRLSLNVIELT